MYKSVLKSGTLHVTYGNKNKYTTTKLQLNSPSYSFH